MNVSYCKLILTQMPLCNTSQPLFSWATVRPVRLRTNGARDHWGLTAHCIAHERQPRLTAQHGNYYVCALLLVCWLKSWRNCVVQILFKFSFKLRYFHIIIVVLLSASSVSIYILFLPLWYGWKGATAALTTSISCFYQLFLIIFDVHLRWGQT